MLMNVGCFGIMLSDSSRHLAAHILQYIGLLRSIVHLCSDIYYSIDNFVGKMIKPHEVVDQFVDDNILMDDVDVIIFDINIGFSGWIYYDHTISGDHYFVILHRYSNYILD